MLRVIVEKKRAALLVILLLVVIALSTIWPLGRWHRKVFVDSGDVTQMSEPIKHKRDAGEYFIAQYPHLNTISVYVAPGYYGDNFNVKLFEVEDDGSAKELTSDYIDMPEETGWMDLKMGVDVEPGHQYIFMVIAQNDGGYNSRLQLGYTDAQSAQGRADRPEYVSAFWRDTTVDGAAVAMKITYTRPFNAKETTVLAAGVLILGAIAAGLILLFYREFPTHNTLVSVRTILQRTLTPAVIAGGALAMCAVWPMKLFDGRRLDIAVYETGLILFIAAALYALWHREDGRDSRDPMDIARNWKRVLTVAAIALILKFSSDYMNALSDVTHVNCMHWIIVLLCVIVLLMGESTWSLNRWTGLTAVLGAAAGTVWYQLTKEGPSVQYYAEHNSNRFSLVFAAVFAAAAVVSTLCMLMDLRAAAAEGSGRRIRLNRMLIAPLTLWLAGMVIFRNTRTWMPVLAGLIALFTVRYAGTCLRAEEESAGVRGAAQQWLRDVCRGICLHFVCNVIWCLFHRYYLAYTYNRFSLQFHTVTVTSYYLLIVSCAAAVLLFERWRVLEAQGENLRGKIRRSFGQEILFGIAASYMLMSLTRAGIYVFAASVLLAVLCTFIGKKGARIFGGPVRVLVCLVLLTALCFPQVYTLQRMVSTMWARPVHYEDVEPYAPEVTRDPEWNATCFMNAEIFIRDFGDRIIGGNLGSKIYYGHGWNEEQGYETSWRTGFSPKLCMTADGTATESGSSDAITAKEGAEPEERTALLAGGGLATALYDTASASPLLLTGAADATAAYDQALTDEIGSLDEGDYSNGRTVVWKLYLQALNMTGHDSMGVTLSSGQTLMHAHNTFLQMAYDCGIPVGVLFCITVLAAGISCIVFFVRGRGRSCLTLLPGLLLTGFIMTGMVEWIFQMCNPFTIVLLFACLPLCVREQQ